MRLLIRTLFAVADSWALVPTVCYRTTKITGNSIVQPSLFQPVTTLRARVAVSTPVTFTLIVSSMQLGALKGTMVVSIHGVVVIQFGLLESYERSKESHTRNENTEKSVSAHDS